MIRSMRIGKELVHHPQYSFLEKAYIRLLGVPIVGLRIRARNAFSLIPQGRTYFDILDAGAGLGVFSFELAKAFPEANVLGIDVSEETVQAAEHIRSRVAARNVRFRVADVVKLDERNRFDLALCIDILEHIEEDREALNTLYRALRSPGILVLHVPSLYRRYPVWKRSLNFEVEGHVRVGYELSQMENMVRDTGFSIAASGYTYGFLETLSNNLSYMISRAKMQNKTLYALAFPLLNLLSWLGAKARPKTLGAGIYVVAEKRSGSDDVE